MRSRISQSVIMLHKPYRGVPLTAPTITANIGAIETIRGIWYANAHIAAPSVPVLSARRIARVPQERCHPEGMKRPKDLRTNVIVKSIFCTEL